MLALEAVEKSFGARSMLRQVTWQIPRNARIGLVGPNGAGKTTFLRVLVGLEEIDRGRVIRPKDVQVGFLPQEIALSERHGTLLETVLKGREDLLELEAELERLESNLGADAKSRDVYGDLQERFRHEGGYEFRSRAREIAAGIGFKEADFDRPIVEFSGGWQMRALLARLLFRKPNLLLLDEPTNHLDMASIEWLERFLGRYEGTVIIVSHDRFFLNRMVDQIVELNAGVLTVYQGNYDRYQVVRAEERERQRAAALRQGKEIERVEAFIDRFRSKATKAAQVQSRVKQLEKLERIEGPTSEAGRVQFRFPQPPRLGKVVADGRNLKKHYGDKRVYDGLNFTVHRGEKLALVGPNGAGKTTLLRMLAGVESPDAGTVEWGNKVDVAYFAQHALEALNPAHTRCLKRFNRSRRRSHQAWSVTSSARSCSRAMTCSSVSRCSRAAKRVGSPCVNC
ncbi:MAG: ABC-F family ATP-binding cassette domain-containing protein [bacterium]